MQLYVARYSTTPGNAVTFGHLPAGQNKFQDERVRQAVSMSWDRDLYIRSQVLQRRQVRGSGPAARHEVELPPELQDAYKAGGWFLDPQG